MVGGAGRDRVRLPACGAHGLERLLPARPESDVEARVRQPHVGAHDPREQDVADPLVARIVPVDPVLLHEDALQAEVRSDGGDLARVIRLHAADRHERVAALRERVGGEELELPRLVAAVREAGVAVVALRPHVHLAAEVLAQPGEAMHRRRPEEERDARERVGVRHLRAAERHVAVRRAGALDHDLRHPRARTTGAAACARPPRSPRAGSSPRPRSPTTAAIGVATKPGQIATARTPSASSSSLSERVSEITAAFVAP